MFFFFSKQCLRVGILVSKSGILEASNNTGLEVRSLSNSQHFRFNLFRNNSVKIITHIEFLCMKSATSPT